MNIGCSTCLAVSIYERNWSKLEGLLSMRCKYSDTYWLPVGTTLEHLSKCESSIEYNKNNKNNNSTDEHAQTTRNQNDAHTPSRSRSRSQSSAPQAGSDAFHPPLTEQTAMLFQHSSRLEDANLPLDLAACALLNTQYN